jgi:hypothetical protein
MYRIRFFALALALALALASLLAGLGSDWAGAVSIVDMSRSGAPLGEIVADNSGRMSLFSLGNGRAIVIDSVRHGRHGANGIMSGSGSFIVRAGGRKVKHGSFRGNAPGRKKNVRW